MAGESVPCYKVAADANGKHFEGYLPASAIDGLNSFEQGRREASWVSTTEALNAARSAQPMSELTASSTNTNAPDRATRILMAQASALIEGNQPGKALALLEPEVKKHSNPTAAGHRGGGRLGAPTMDATRSSTGASHSIWSPIPESRSFINKWSAEADQRPERRETIRRAGDAAI